MLKFIKDLFTKPTSDEQKKAFIRVAASSYRYTPPTEEKLTSIFESEQFKSAPCFESIPSAIDFLDDNHLLEESYTSRLINEVPGIKPEDSIDNVSKAIFEHIQNLKAKA